MRESISPGNPQVDALLEQLKANDASKRESAAKKLGRLGVGTDEVVAALHEMAREDPNPYPRRAAREALTKLGETAPPAPPDELGRGKRRGKVYSTQRERYIDGAIGLVGWFVINGGIWLMLTPTFLKGDACNGPCGYAVLGAMFLLIPLNVLSLGAMYLFRYWISYGMLTAYVLNLAISVLFAFYLAIVSVYPLFDFLGRIFSGVFGIPFFSSPIGD